MLNMLNIVTCLFLRQNNNFILVAQVPTFFFTEKAEHHCLCPTKS